MGPPGPAASPTPGEEVFKNSSLTGTAALTSAGTTVALLTNLPAGNYLVMAKVTVGANSGSQDSCTLLTGSTVVDISFATANVSVGIIWETAKLLGTVALPTSTNSISVTCANSAGSGMAQYPVLTAIKVGSVTTQ
jgi:hypothetical protein